MMAKSTEGKTTREKEIPTHKTTRTRLAEIVMPKNIPLAQQAPVTRPPVPKRVDVRNGGLLKKYSLVEARGMSDPK